MEDLSLKNFLALFFVFFIVILPSNAVSSDIYDSHWNDLAKALEKENYNKVTEILGSYDINSFEDDDSDLIFATLAFAYGKSGSIEKAEEILKDKKDKFSRLVFSLVNNADTGDLLKGEKVNLYFEKVTVRGASKNGASGFESIVYKKAYKSILKKIARKQGKEYLDVKDFDRGKYYFTHYIISEREEKKGYVNVLVAMFMKDGDFKKALKEPSVAPKNNISKPVKISSKDLLPAMLISSARLNSIRKKLNQNLLDIGLVSRDIGSGTYTKELFEKTKGTIVLEIMETFSVKGKVLGSNIKNYESKITVSFLNGNDGNIIDSVSVAKTVSSIDKEGAKVKALNASIDEISPKLANALKRISKEKGKEIISGAKPKLQFTFNKVENIFASIYKYYALKGASKVTLENNSKEKIKNLAVTYYIKDFMEYPTKTFVGTLNSGQKKKVNLKAIFNTALIDLTDDGIYQAQIVLTYVEGGVKRKLIFRKELKVYEKHALIWDDKGKIASFLTVKDPVLKGFASSSVREYNYPYLYQSIVKARAVFSAMSVLGITYVLDPVPYSQVSKKLLVDTVQFPRETLTRKAGDCDDLVSLFGAALESVGVRVMPIEAPGHIFIMFDTGIAGSLSFEFGFADNRYIVHNGTIWIPFETTLVGQSFILAWEKGADNYQKWKDDVTIIDLKEVWDYYPPATLPNDEFKQKVNMKMIEDKFPLELESLTDKRVYNLIDTYSRLGTYGMKQSIILYGENNMIDEALKLSKDLEKMGRGEDSAFYNNMGNLYFLKKKYKKALSYYNKALKKAPRDAMIYVNLARAYIENGNKGKAKKNLKKAIKLNPKLKEKYVKLVVRLGL